MKLLINTYNTGDTDMSVNLTKDAGCFTSCLTANIETLCQMASDDYTSKDELVDWIVNLIEPAFYNREAKPRFINDIRFYCRTKSAVLKRCFNAISNAIEYQA
jgi:hypothetical protein